MTFLSGKKMVYHIITSDQVLREVNKTLFNLSQFFKDTHEEFPDQPIPIPFSSEEWDKYLDWFYTGEADMVALQIADYLNDTTTSKKILEKKPDLNLELSLFYGIPDELELRLETLELPQYMKIFYVASTRNRVFVYHIVNDSDIYLMTDNFPGRLFGRLITNDSIRVTYRGMTETLYYNHRLEFLHGRRLTYFFDGRVVVRPNGEELTINLPNGFTLRYFLFWRLVKNGNIVDSSFEFYRLKDGNTKLITVHRDNNDITINFWDLEKGIKTKYLMFENFPIERIYHVSFTALYFRKERLDPSLFVLQYNHLGKSGSYEICKERKVMKAYLFRKDFSVAQHDILGNVYAYTSFGTNKIERFSLP